MMNTNDLVLNKAYFMYNAILTTEHLGRATSKIASTAQILQHPLDRHPLYQPTSTLSMTRRTKNKIVIEIIMIARARACVCVCIERERESHTYQP